VKRPLLFVPVNAGLADTEGMQENVSHADVCEGRVPLRAGSSEELNGKPSSPNAALHLATQVAFGTRTGQ